MRRLVLVTDGTGVNMLTSILLQHGPLEALLQGITGPMDPKMARKLGGVSPLEHVGPLSRRNEETGRGTGSGTRLILQSGSDPLLHLPGQGSNHTGRREDRIGSLTRFLLLLEQAGQGVRLDIVAPGAIREGDVESGEEEGPVGLTEV